MSRPLRIEFPDALYHVTSRGDRREDIYEDDEDRRVFLEFLAEVVGQFKCIAIAGSVGLAVLLSSCSFVSQQLADKRMEEKLLKPGALDSDIAINFDEYRFRFLDKYQISHAWPVTSTCKYSGLRTRYKMGDMSYGDVYSVDDIYEEGNITRQREADPSWNFDRFVRSHKVKRPVSEVVDGVIVASKNPRYEENEEGLQPMCFEAWVGTSHAVTLMLYKRTIKEWEHALTRWSQGMYAGLYVNQFEEVVLENKWRVYRVPLKPRMLNRIAGSYELRILPIGDTGYSLALELGANLESLQNPRAHSAFQAMFNHLVESVKVEPITPAIETEMEQLKAQAEEVVRQNCIGMAKRTKPPAWCQKYLNR